MRDHEAQEAHEGNSVVTFVTSVSLHPLV